MKVVKPSVRMIDLPNIERIELGARCCWASEDKICEGSANKMFESMVKRQHFSPMEHSNIIVQTMNDEATAHLIEILVEYESITGIPSYIRYYGHNSKTAMWSDNVFSGNVRSWRNIYSKYFSEPIFARIFEDKFEFKDIADKNMFRGCGAFDSDPWSQSQILTEDPYGRDRHKIATFEVCTSRAVADELMRHRCVSPSCQSQRYINFGDFTICEPWFFDELSKSQKMSIEYLFEVEENSYGKIGSLLDVKQNQKCRVVLPMQTMTKLIVTATVENWKNIVLPLRTSEAAYPDMRIIASMIKELIEKEYA